MDSKETALLERSNWLTGQVGTGCRSGRGEKERGGGAGPYPFRVHGHLHQKELFRWKEEEGNYPELRRLIHPDMRKKCDRNLRKRSEDHPWNYAIRLDSDKRTGRRYSRV